MTDPTSPRSSVARMPRFCLPGLIRRASAPMTRPATESDHVFLQSVAPARAGRVGRTARRRDECTEPSVRVSVVGRSASAPTQSVAARFSAWRRSQLVSVVRAGSGLTFGRFAQGSGAGDLEVFLHLLRRRVGTDRLGVLLCCLRVVCAPRLCPACGGKVLIRFRHRPPLRLGLRLRRLPHFGASMPGLETRDVWPSLALCVRQRRRVELSEVHRVDRRDRGKMFAR
jgi:hypothetical protein